MRLRHELSVALYAGYVLSSPNEGNSGSIALERSDWMGAGTGADHDDNDYHHHHHHRLVRRKYDAHGSEKERSALKTAPQTAPKVPSSPTEKEGGTASSEPKAKKETTSLEEELRKKLKAFPHKTKEQLQQEILALLTEIHTLKKNSPHIESTKQEIGAFYSDNLITTRNGLKEEVRVVKIEPWNVPVGREGPYIHAEDAKKVSEIQHKWDTFLRNVAMVAALLFLVLILIYGTWTLSSSHNRDQKNNVNAAPPPPSGP